MRDRLIRCLVVFPADGLGGAGATARPPSNHLHVSLPDRLQTLSNHKPQQFWLLLNKRAQGVKSSDAALSGTGLLRFASSLIQLFLKVSRSIHRARAQGRVWSILSGGWSKVWGFDLLTDFWSKTHDSPIQRFSDAT
ncbi:MAG: hypothetical protein CMN10_11300 [Roseobacter sp.]|nr:hypothetical protein [Roseobacter sp.]MBV49137.1 hypothetical protein [Roseobacter sp.]